jgi:hypothetical protein
LREVEAPTFSGIRLIDGGKVISSGGALRPDSGPYAALSVLRPTLLHRVCWESPDAPLRAASFLDCAQSFLSFLGRRPSHPTVPVWVLLRVSFRVRWSPSPQTRWHRLWITFLPSFCRSWRLFQPGWRPSWRSFLLDL